MFVLTSDGSKTVLIEKGLTVSYEEHRDHGHDSYIQLHSDDGAYLSAIGDGFGPYILEWFPREKTGIHLRAAEELRSQEVLDAMLDFRRGRSAWRESHTCHETEEERPSWLARFLGRFFRKQN